MTTFETFITMDDYRSLIRHELIARKKHDPKYSLRAFCRDMGILHSRMSEILNKKQGLSQKRARSLAERLWRTDPYVQYFTDLVTQEHSRKSDERRAAKERISRLRSQVRSNEVNSPWTHSVLSWLSFASKELKEEAARQWFNEITRAVAHERTSEYLEKLIREGYLEISPDRIILKFPPKS